MTVVPLISAHSLGIGSPPMTSGQTGTNSHEEAKAFTAWFRLDLPSYLHSFPRRQALTATRTLFTLSPQTSDCLLHPDRERSSAASLQGDISGQIQRYSSHPEDSTGWDHTIALPQGNHQYHKEKREPDKIRYMKEALEGDFHGP